MPDTGRASTDGVNSTTPAQTAQKSKAERLPAGARGLLMEEYKHRRVEISATGARMEADNRYALLLTGAVWSWLAANHAAIAGQGYFPHVVAFMPAALMAFYFWRWYAMHRMILKNAEYLREIEAAFAVGDLGWETWLHDKRANDLSAASLRKPGQAFWMLLAAINVLLAVLFVAFKG